MISISGKMSTSFYSPIYDITYILIAPLINTVGMENA